MSSKNKNYVVINTSTRQSPDYGDLAQILTREEAETAKHHANERRPAGTPPYAVYVLRRIY